MSTNFFIGRTRGKVVTRDRHVGKRCAAGLYCWDCGVPLVLNGDPALVHEEAPTLDACPRCGKPAPKSDALKDAGNPVGIELGFAIPRRVRPTGITGVSSFTWAMEPVEVRRIMRHRGWMIDEYGKRLGVARPARGR